VSKRFVETEERKGKDGVTYRTNTNHTHEDGGKTYEHGHAHNKSTVSNIYIEFGAKEERE